MLLLLACGVVNNGIGQEGHLSVANGNLVYNTEEFKVAIESASPGDTILLANGVWKDAELKFVFHGKRDSPIYILAQEKGKVFFEGQSNIKMGGDYVHLEGLVFRNGYTPTSSVISLQKDKSTPCNHCRVTECVIDNYNPTERFDTDYWIEIFGKYNRIDHNYLVGKRNRGVTMAVRLKNEHDRKNFHRIDHNFFGYHPILGSNGGETLRIGTSHYSLSNSNTVVEDNYFERCNGEHEIISSKSCQNVFRNNTFYECQGTLTMRHGNETIVENNYFFGNGKPNTGGIRIINEAQVVRNNFLYGLTGHRFRGALVIMNGVPNSPLNRYFQVKDSEMSHNLLMDCDHVQLCAGSDEERSATPSNTKFFNNVILHSNKENVFTIYDDVSGISFSSNWLSRNMDIPVYGKKELTGFKTFDLPVSQDKKFVTVENNVHVGCESTLPVPSAKNTGVNWYPKKDYRIRFKVGKTIVVDPGENTIFEAIKSAEDGDVILLKSGEFHSTRSIVVNKAVSIIGEDMANRPVLTFERSPLFALENGGSLELDRLIVDGDECDDYSGNSVVRTSRYSMIDNYKLFVKRCDVKNLDVNHSFNFLKVYKNTFADSIVLMESNFQNISGHVLNLDKEIDDTGIYNAETVVIDSCQFTDVGGNVIKLYRGGRDESTFGPMLWMTDSQLANVGHDARNKNDSSIHLHGVQYAEIENVEIRESKKLKLHLLVGEPVIKLSNVYTENSDVIESNSNAYITNNFRQK